MENFLTDLLSSKINEDFVSGTGQKVGLDSEKTNSVVSEALPFLLGALAKNTENPEGAAALQNALKKDHDGSVLDDLGGLLANPEKGKGEGILKHILGNQLGGVEGLIASKTGADKKGVNGVLKMLAPVILGGLGKMQQKGNLDASQLSNLLKMATGSTGAKSISMSFVTSFLDKNGDGSVKDDLLKMFLAWVTKFFKK